MVRLYHYLTQIFKLTLYYYLCSINPYNTIESGLVHIPILWSSLVTLSCTLWGLYSLEVSCHMALTTLRLVIPLHSSFLGKQQFWTSLCSQVSLWGVLLHEHTCKSSWSQWAGCAKCWIKNVFFFFSFLPFPHSARGVESIGHDSVGDRRCTLIAWGSLYVDLIRQYAAQAVNLYPFGICVWDQKWPFPHELNMGTSCF